MSVLPSVRPYVRPYVPCSFRKTIVAVFEGRKSSDEVIINKTMSDDEVVASDVPPRYLFLFPLVIRDRCDAVAATDCA